MIEKGSVTIDGVSLTVNRIEGDVLELGIIPHTIQNTTLAIRKVGDEVNVEVDVIGKYVEKLMRNERRPGDSGGITWEMLAKHGFGD